MNIVSKTLWSGLALAGLSSMSQALEANWLYLSDTGTWVSRNESLLSETTQLQLPVKQLQAHQFWWQTDADDVQLIWTQPGPLGLPQKGDPVEIQGEAGLWLVKDVSTSHLVLQQGRNVRYWPQSQWHLLSWTSTAELGLSLTVKQPEKSKVELFYAWQSTDLTAEVRYRLNEQGEQTRLVQELVVTNHSDIDYKARGYSYAQSVNRPPVAMARTLSVESDTAPIGTPQAGQSQGIPTLMSDQPVELTASSNIWLPVSHTVLSSVERQYQMTWDSRQQGLQRAQSALKITSSSPLPDLAGPVKIGVFDRQVAVMESQYQPSSANQALIQLGQSALVTMLSRQIREGEWQLQFSNRSEEPADVALTVTHWNGKTSQRVPVTVRLAAQSEKTVAFELSNGGLIQLRR